MTGKKGKLTKARKTLAKENYTEKYVPRSFVINRGEVSTCVKQLINDFRLVMKPNTAKQVFSKKKSKMRDFASLAGPLNVTHLMLFAQKEAGLNFKISRLPQGPTLCFRIENYSLLGDVISAQTQQMLDNKHLLYAPCLITNLQPSDGQQHLQLCSKMFLDMFPTISPPHVKTREIRRCCLIHYNEESDVFNFRHYAIKTRPQGISKATRKLIGRKVPNLSAYKELSDFVAKSEIYSDSEVEDDSNRINICNTRKGTTTNHRSVVKLTEIGPRLTLTLVKIEDGLCGGNVLYHKYVEKTAEEKLELQKKQQEQKEMKKKRKKQQEENIKLKKEKKEAHRQQCLMGMGIDSSKRKHDDDDDDAIYFREEVGEEPQEDLFRGRPVKDKSEYKKFSKKNKKN